MIRRALAALAPLAVALTLAAASPQDAQAQSGRITGSVADSAARPIAGALVSIIGTALRSITDDAGKFAISGVAAGTYELRAQRLGQRAVSMPGVAVRPNEDTKVSFVLTRAPIELSSIVVSASRRAEKITDAP